MEPSPLSKSARLGVNSLEGGVRTASNMSFKCWRRGGEVGCFLVLLAKKCVQPPKGPLLPLPSLFSKANLPVQCKESRKEAELASHGREKSLA